MRLAIDFGTTNTTVAYLESIDESAGDIEAGIRLFQDTEIHFGYHGQTQKALIPSVVGTQNGQTVIGEQAKNANDAFYHGKMELYNHPQDESIQGKVTMFLHTLLDRMVKEIGFNKTQDTVILTCPVETADFAKSRKYAEILKQIFINYGIPQEHLSSVSEPLAASIFYRTLSERRSLDMLVDFGGGTIDVLLYSVDPNGSIALEHKCGDASVGGREIDRVLAREFFKIHQKKLGEDVLPDNPVLLKAMEAEKILCGALEADPNQSKRFIFQGIEHKWSFKEIENLLREDKYLARLTGVFRNLEKTLEENVNSKLKEIQKVILVGGTSNLPLVKDILHREFVIDKSRFVIDQSEMFTCMVKGALIHSVKPDYTSKKLKFSYFLKVCRDLETKEIDWRLLFEKGSEFPQSVTLRLKAAETKRKYGIDQTHYCFEISRQASGEAKKEDLGCQLREKFSETCAEKELTAEFAINPAGELLVTVQEQPEGLKSTAKILSRII